MEEKWKSLKVNKNYQVSNLGRVRSLDRVDSLGRFRKGKVLKNTVTSQGYLQVGISPSTYLVGNLVLTTFVCERPEGHLVHYSDGNIKNVELSNLSWSTEVTQKPELNLTCKAAECRNKPRSSSADYCEMHYYRLRRNGTLDIVASRIPDAICRVRGCNNKAQHTNGLCRNCHLRYERNGSFEHHHRGELHNLWLSNDDVTYTAVHQRLRHYRGNAREYKCVDCGTQAQHWSYNHDADNEKVEQLGMSVVPFSPDLTHYSPRCVRCHKHYDMMLVKGKHGA